MKSEPNMSIRSERPQDRIGVDAVLRSAFPTDAEARLVDQLRAGAHAPVSLVAEMDGRVVGHILFSPVTIGRANVSVRGLGLGPLAVLPSHQGRGVGSALVREGLTICRRQGWAFVVVVGGPGYYQRFGFKPGSEAGLRNEFGVADEFMVHELLPGSLPTEGGLARYGAEFEPWKVH